MSAKIEILKTKIKKMIESTDEAKKEFLIIMACHNGHVMPASISTSFKEFKKKHEDEGFNKIKSDLVEEGIIFIPVSEYPPIQFSLRNEKGDYDSQRGEELSKYIGRLFFEQNLILKETIEKIVNEPGGKEFLGCVATEKGIETWSGREPKIIELIGKHSYDEFVRKLSEVGVLNEYAWSSRKYDYRGYKLLPFVDDFIKEKLGIFTLNESEKLILCYVSLMKDLFGYANYWYTQYPDSSCGYFYAKKKSSLHMTLIADLCNISSQQVLEIINKLREKKLLWEVDLGTTRSGSHRGVALEVAQIAKNFVEQTKHEFMQVIEDKVKEIFESEEACATYYLFGKETIPIELLSSIYPKSVELLQRTGLIAKENGEFISFQDTRVFNYINSKIYPDKFREDFRRALSGTLSQDERSLLGYLSQFKQIILGKYQDTTTWYSRTSRTQRNYEDAYQKLVENISHIKKLYYDITNKSFEWFEAEIKELERRGFLIREKEMGFGFPGHAIVYRIPVKFEFKIDTSSMNVKAREYMNFLSKDLEKNYRQVIFLDHLLQYEDFTIPNAVIRQICDFLFYEPPMAYSVVYAIEYGSASVNPWVREELKKSIFDLKHKLLQDIRNSLIDFVQLCKNNLNYNCTEMTTKDGYLIIDIESPDPAVGIVSFVLIPWILPQDSDNITNACNRSNTINLFFMYPDYYSVAKLSWFPIYKYNFIIMKKDELSVAQKKYDKITENALSENTK